MSTFYNIPKIGLSVSLEQLATMTPKQLLEVHNQAARHGNQPKVSRFSDRNAALRRTKAMLAAVCHPANAPLAPTTQAPASQAAGATDEDEMANKAKAAEATTKTKKTKQPKEPGARKGRASKFGEDSKITVVNKAPRREGTPAAERFRLFKTGQTVAAYREAVKASGLEVNGKPDWAMVELRYAVGKGYVTVG